TCTVAWPSSRSASKPSVSPTSLTKKSAFASWPGPCRLVHCKSSPPFSSPSPSTTRHPCSTPISSRRSIISRTRFRPILRVATILSCSRAPTYKPQLPECAKNLNFVPSSTHGLRLSRESCNCLPVRPSWPRPQVEPSSSLNWARQVSKLFLISHPDCLRPLGGKRKNSL